MYFSQQWQVWQHRNRYRVLILVTGLMLLAGGISLYAPGTDAQGTFATNTPVAPSGVDQPPPASSFATNTPAGQFQQPVVPFATNTPMGGVPDAPTATPTPAGPTTSVFNYSLRLWLEDAMLNQVADQIAALQDDDTAERRLALQLTLYELQRRFPQAPTSPERRERLVESMLDAPRGSIDMREIVRPYILDALNDNPSRTEFTYNGFDVTVQAANLNNRGAEDAVLHIRYTDDDDVLRYDDFALVLGTENGTYSGLPDNSGMFAAPFDDTEALMLRRVDDVNQDSLDEVVIRVADEQVNDRLFILQVRNDRVTDLTPTDARLRFSEVIRWPLDADLDEVPELVVNTLREESTLPDWPCVSQQEFTWRYERNLYRPSTAINSRFTPVDSLGCTLHEQEPLFERPVPEAIAIVENSLVQYSFEAPGANRALMTLAMLYVLTGRLDDARATAEAVLPVDAPDTWEHEQATALIEASGISSNTPLDICEALAVASDDPACDMNAVLGNYLDNLEIATADDLVTQLEEFGLPVLESVTVREVGRAERIAVNFALADSSWWGFVAGREGLYNAEPIDPPETFAETTLPVARIQPSRAAYNALLLNDNPRSALNILSNLEQTNPGVPFSPEGLYLRALAYDLTASRDDARLTYYDLWQTFPNTIWGELASEHLERR
jgi:hypothetical protein